jgi:hypothetical protein
MALQWGVDKRESKKRIGNRGDEKRLLFIFGVLTEVALQRKGSAVMPLEPSGTREKVKVAWDSGKSVAENSDKNPPKTAIDTQS